MIIINAFMALPDKQKMRFTLVTFPSGYINDICEHDIIVYDNIRHECDCETCGISADKLIGTHDEVEPLFCFSCYKSINERSLFYIKSFDEADIVAGKE